MKKNFPKGFLHILDKNNQYYSSGISEWEKALRYLSTSYLNLR